MNKTLHFTELVSDSDDYASFARERGLKFEARKIENDPRHLDYIFTGPQDVIETALSELGHDNEDLQDGTVVIGDAE
jgi:hypothetical protein